MKDIPKAKLMETILVISTGLLVLFYFTENKWSLYAALAIGLLGLLSTTIAKLITFAWYKLAEVLGFINSRIILGLLFFIFLVPIALLARVFQKKKDPLQLRKQTNGSYFKTVNKKFSAKDLENLW